MRTALLIILWHEVIKIIAIWYTVSTCLVTVDSFCKVRTSSGGPVSAFWIQIVFKKKTWERSWKAEKPLKLISCVFEPKLTGNKNIINYTKAQRLAWFGHVHRRPNNSRVKKVYEWSPALTRSLGRPKNRWEDDVKSDITWMKITNWNDCIRNRIKWKKVVEKAKITLKL
jgi:hypothetical protein